MIEDSKIVKSIEEKTSNKGTTYWTVTWQAGKFDNIFNAEWLPLLEQSQQENRMLHFTKEKAEGSKYYNIKTLELATLPDKTPAPIKTYKANNALPGDNPPEPKDEIAPQERGMWWKEAGECIRSGEIDTPYYKQLKLAYYTEMFRVLGIQVKEVQPATKSRLVEKAKELGATEVEPGDIPFAERR